MLADPATPPPAGFTSATFGAAIDAARTAGKPLQVRAGNYSVSNIDILTTNGAGRGIEIYCPAGIATLVLSGGSYGPRIAGQTGMIFRNIAFDGQNLGLPAYSAPNVITAAAGLVILDNARDTVFRHCFFRNTVKTGSEPTGAYKAGLLCVNDSRPTVTDCTFDNVDIAIWSFSSETIVDGCRITGANGNGVAVYLANDVSIKGNIILNCDFSAVRINGGSRCIIADNTCWNIREGCLYYEAPAAGQDGTGVTIVNNKVDMAGDGIYVTNSGYFGDGTARRAVVQGNQVSNLSSNAIPASGGIGPYSTMAIGVTVEQDCVISGNIVESALGGIKLGVAQGARDLVCDGNLLRQCGVGIAFSANASAGKMVISNNVITGSGGNAIVSATTIGLAPPLVSYNANTLSQTVGSGSQILIAHNRAS